MKVQIKVRAAENPRQTNTRIYIFNVDHGSAAEADALDEALTTIGAVDAQVRWSQRAGCSCGCSPGFILKGGAKEVFVDVGGTNYRRGDNS